MIESLILCFAELAEGDTCGTEAETHSGLSSGGSLNDQGMFEGFGGSLSSRNPNTREHLSVSSIRQAVIPCQSGLVCGRDDLTSRVCRTENTNGQYNIFNMLLFFTFDCMYMYLLILIGSTVTVLL